MGSELQIFCILDPKIKSNLKKIVCDKDFAQFLAISDAFGNFLESNDVKAIVDLPDKGGTFRPICDRRYYD